MSVSINRRCASFVKGDVNLRQTAKNITIDQGYYHHGNIFCIEFLVNGDVWAGAAEKLILAGSPADTCGIDSCVATNIQQKGGHMKIAAASVSMDAASTYREVEERTSRLNPITGEEDPASADDFGIRLSQSITNSNFTQFTSQSVVGPADSNCSLPEQDGSNPDTTEKNVVSQLAEQVLGHPVVIGEVQGILSTPTPAAQSLLGAHSSIAIERAELTSSIVYHQEETMLFSARGQVQTADGREISFNLGLSMERRTVITESTSMDLTMFVDPLVLRFDTAPPLLSDMVFSFDLDSDGRKEQLACPGRGCGFLAFDRNKDGRINNGLELFGPATGAGFSELANLDSDSNAWIDENDPIFSSLSIWSFDENGGESLCSLRDAGVGAISITHAGSTFQLQDADGGILGTVKASGIFLTESGEVRSLQEVDLATSIDASSIKSEPSLSGKGRLDSAMQTLQTIMHMQQVRLKMRLAEQQLQGTTRRAEQRKWLLHWLQNRSEWHAMTSIRNKGEEGFLGAIA